MDTDLFQGVLLGLLAVGLVVLIALLGTLGGIRKALEQRATEERAPSGGEGGASTTEPDQTEPGRTESTESPAGEATAPAETEAPSTEAPAVASSAYTGAGSYATPRARQEAPAPSDSGERADSIRSVLQDHGVDADQKTEAEPAPAAADEPAVDSAFAGYTDDPQEEPFQREGRWWFRRGDELLLYDESSGQWKPAPESAQTPQATTATAAAAPAEETPVAAEAADQTASMPVADQVSTFWKCPTCGAVNGSTAATCRMCFAGRP